MNISYKDSREVHAEDVAKVFEHSGIKRPYQDLERIKRMIQNADIMITAWDNDTMIGVARALTDYSYCCYLSDLAVDKRYQHRGIGKELVELVRNKVGDECSIVLLSAPDAVDFYPKIGFTRSERAFVIARQK